MTTEVLTQQDVWLFTKDHESVRLSVRPAPGGYRLTVFGPGLASAEFGFAEFENLERFRTQYEQDLLARGFRVQAAVERRGGTDRRSTPRSTTSRRR